MSRRVVTQGVARCERCRQAHRWCVCAGLRQVECPLPVDVLIHRAEWWKPTSTGRLITRVMPSARGHVFSSDVPLARDGLIRAGRTLWILHPAGEPLRAAGAEVDTLQVLLLDGSWREAAKMRKVVESWGRLVSLPAGEPSRFRLRDQHSEERYSTVEALLILLRALGLEESAQALRVQFELHVYASLRMRGAIREAEEFLRDSVLPGALPEVLDDLCRRRPSPPPRA